MLTLWLKPAKAIGPPQSDNLAESRPLIDSTFWQTLIQPKWGVGGELASWSAVSEYVSCPVLFDQSFAIESWPNWTSVEAVKSFLLRYSTEQ